MSDTFDLIIIGAGSGGLAAAGFAGQLDARVALVERQRIGGDCTWTGCVPSKALLKAAKVAHEARSADHYGIITNPPQVDMMKVRDYVRKAIAEVYQHESPEALRRDGLEVLQGEARFLDARSIAVGARRLSAKNFLITTGARPAVPKIPGIADVPYLTYEQIFDNERLPERMIVIGGGPIGTEMAQAYQRLGAQVTMVAERLLPKEEPEVAAVLETVLRREGMQFVKGRPAAVRHDGAQTIVTVGAQELTCDLLLVATGRTPTVDTLDLERAGVTYTPKGIPVDDNLRTNVKHIYAAGDVIGSYQFTHYASWQAFWAVRNILLPGSSLGVSEAVPWVTYTDPEVAHVGLTEEQARAKFGTQVVVSRWDMSRTDRAVCENDLDGFLKVVHKRDGTILGATMVAARAGEAITEIILAVKMELKVGDLANAIHAYPTYSTGIMQLSSSVAIANRFSGTSGKVLKGLAKLIR